MPVQTPTRPDRSRRRLPGVLLFAVALTSPLFGRAPDAHTRIPLEPLGLQHLPPQLVTAGSSLLTLHYVDDKHLLVTFAVRRLMKRLPEDAPEDFDRTVDAVLLDLPSGKVLARTSWRLHDTGRYLWSLGHGRFLLRIHDRISTLAPLANLAAGNAFLEYPLLDTPRRIAVILVSPDASLLTLETTKRRSGPNVDPVVPVPAPPPRRAGVLIPRSSEPEAKTEERIPFQINFFRLVYPTSPDDGVRARYAGVIGSNRPVTIPADSSGFLNIVDESDGHWAFNFNTYAGKTEELSPFDSNCQPFPEFVSRSEFVAFGCRNSQDPQVFAGFNLRGEQMWQQVLTGAYISPSLAFSPESDRFVLSRVMTTGTVPAIGDPVEGQLGSQSITVYQTDSGRQIFNISCTPVSRTGENFAISPDGMELAVVREGVVEVYRLPELSGKDRAGLKKAESLVPPLDEGPVRIYVPLSATAARLAALTASQKTKVPEAQISTESPPTPDAEPPVADPPMPSPVSKTGAPRTSTPDSTSTTKTSGVPVRSSAPASGDRPATSGDVEGSRRKPPTLYNLPGDSPGNPPQ